MKKAFKISFFITLAVIVILVALLVVGFIVTMNNPSPSVGIIGGADGPTAIFVTRTLVFDNPAFVALFAASPLCVASLIGWLVTKNK